MGDGFQYGDIIFLGLIALFVGLRLRAMLGKDQGIDPRETWKQATREVVQEKVIQIPDRVTKAQKKEEELILENLKATPSVAEGLKAIKLADNQFNTAEFVIGSKTAFEWLVGAFSKGEKEKLRILLSEERFREFSSEIDANIAAGKLQETTLVAINSADIIEAGMHDGRAQITVKFSTEQVHVVRDKDKNIISGDASVIEHVQDVWTFERDPASRDPNWKIIAT